MPSLRPQLAKITMQAARAYAAAFSRRWNGTTHRLRIACVVLPALLLFGLAWVDYRVELARTRNDVVTTTNALAEHARTVVETVDLVIARVLDHIGQQDWATIVAAPETHEFLDHLRRQLPQVEAVFLVDPNGLIAASSRGYPMPRYDVRDADYFSAAKAGADGAVVITAPFRDTISGTTGFMISRRRELGGRFDGVVGVTVSRQYFGSFYRAILDHPNASAAALVRSDGALLVRFPDTPGDRIVLPMSDALMVAARGGSASGVVGGQSSLDGEPSIAAFRWLRDLPLLVSYSINESVLLTTWAIHVAVIAVCAILLSVLLLATEHLVRRQTAGEHDALRRLVEETERRRQAEARAQQSQKMEALGRLTGGVAHDFNNLLAAILGSLELVLRRESNPRSVRLLQTATEAAQRAARLTAQMLAFSRKHEVVVQSVDVNRVIRGMDDLLCRTLGPSIRLHYDLADDLWPALADPAQLELALLNLAVNARDAMPDGGVLTFRSNVVTVEDADGQEPRLKPGHYVCVEVIDTGVGMSAEVRARAHEPFFTTKGPGGGTGLGLSMVDGFVSELGGALGFTSVPGAGTTVSLLLRKAANAPAADTPTADTDISSTNRRVLLVDDDASVRLSARAMLEELGHEVVEATGGAEALTAIAHDQRFDLLIIDFAMPLMNGSRLATEVTKLWPDAPILFVTGYVENDALRPWSALGYRTVQKPFSTRDLAMAIERAVRHPEATAI
jgi:signal transduction histidine kinase/ActR/RegA family two-component response regulator